MMFNDYEIYYCKKCKKYIHYFKENKFFEEYHCWQCVRDDNKTRELNELIMRKYFDDRSYF